MRVFGILLAMMFFATPSHAAERPRTPDSAYDALVAGNKRFVEALASSKQLPGPAERGTLLEGQAPIAVVLACSDSRVPPERIFDQGRGDIFVVRLAGNIAGELALASIEYGVEVLGAPLLVVMGHEDCGAVKATIGSQTDPVPENLQPLVDAILPAVKEAESDHPDAKGDALLNLAIQQNAKDVADSLLMRSPILRDHHKKGQLRVEPAEFHLKTGKVEWLKEKGHS